MQLKPLANQPSWWGQMSSHKVEVSSLLTFIFLGLFAILNHALWRDEMQAWLIARDSQSWSEFLDNMVPEGHPILWHALLFGLKQVANTPVTMQILHWGLASLALVLFWRNSPFRRSHKILFTFGYFPFYEYFLISRNYVLVEVLSFLFCSLYSLRCRTYIPLVLCIGLLANSHAFSFLIALSLLFVLIQDWFSNPQQRKQYKHYNRQFWQGDLALSGLILIGLMGLAVYSLSQAGSTVSLELFKFDIRQILIVLGRILGGYTLLVPNSRHWVDLWLCGALSLGLIGAIAMYLRRCPIALLFYSSSLLSLGGFNYYLYLGGSPRHYGHYYLVLIVALWLSTVAKVDPCSGKDENSRKNPGKSQQSRTNPQSIQSAFFRNLVTGILVIHLGVGLYYFGRFGLGFDVPFSAGKATANYIKTQGWQDSFMVGSRDYLMAPIAGYLNRTLYYPEIQSQGSFAQWGKQQQVDHQEVLRQVDQLFSGSKLFGSDSGQPLERILLILSQPLTLLNQPENGQENRESTQFSDGLGLTIQPVAQFEQANKSERGADERYYLYWINAEPGQASNLW